MLKRAFVEVRYKEQSARQAVYTMWTRLSMAEDVGQGCGFAGSDVRPNRSSSLLHSPVRYFVYCYLNFVIDSCRTALELRKCTDISKSQWNPLACRHIIIGEEATPDELLSGTTAPGSLASTWKELVSFVFSGNRAQMAPSNSAGPRRGPSSVLVCFCI
jgi:hypothetical protein